MQPKGWIYIFFWIVLTSSGASLCCIKKVDAAQAANTDLSIHEDDPFSKIPSLGVAWIPAQLHQQHKQKASFTNGSGGNTVRLGHLFVETAGVQRSCAGEKELLNNNFSSLSSSKACLHEQISYPNHIGATSFPPEDYRKVCRGAGVQGCRKEEMTSVILQWEGSRGMPQQGVFSHTLTGSTAYFPSAYRQTPALYSQTPPDQAPPAVEQNQISPTPEPNPAPPTPELNQTPAPPPPQPPQPPQPLPNNPPQLEGQPADFPNPLSPPVEERLQVPEIDHAQRLERLLQRLQQTQPPTEPNLPELGRLLVREKPLEQLPLPQPSVSPPQPKPIGYLQAHVGYFHTNNIFSSKANPVEDGLVYSGLTLASTPLALGRRTYLNASIDGNLIRYINQSQYNYNQLRFNVGVFQQLSRRMYGEIGWSNQQLFYARNDSNFSAGDRFLNENSFRLSVGRRDPLTPRLMLDSFYELRLSLTDPPSNQDNRDRVINSVWLSLNYYLQQSLQVGVNYQFGLSNFTRRQREDQYHRLYGHLTYGMSNYTNLSLQGGVILGGSTESNIDFDAWFFSVNYNLELGRF